MESEFWESETSSDKIKKVLLDGLPKGLYRIEIIFLLRFPFLASLHNAATHVVHHHFCHFIWVCICHFFEIIQLKFILRLWNKFRVKKNLCDLQRFRLLYFKKLKFTQYNCSAVVSTSYNTYCKSLISFYYYLFILMMQRLVVFSDYPNIVDKFSVFCL